MRFNPPPNWPPVPPGWTPPPDWRPDPTWPPLPPGWPLWVPDWVPDAPRRKTGLIIGAIAVTLFIGLGAVIALVAVSHRSTAGTASRSTSSVATPESTDEDKVRAVVDQFEKAWNTEDFAALAGLFCNDMRNDPGFSNNSLRSMRASGGELLLKVTSVKVNGKTAKATISDHGKNPDDIAFAREGADWKWCGN